MVCVVISGIGFIIAASSFGDLGDEISFLSLFFYVGVRGVALLSVCSNRLLVGVSRWHDNYIVVRVYGKLGRLERDLRNRLLLCCLLILKMLFRLRFLDRRRAGAVNSCFAMVVSSSAVVCLRVASPYTWS